MYKAGDFTNGKMSEIFKEAAISTHERRGLKKAFISGPIVNHKQFGDFVLIDKELFAVKSSLLYEAITGVRVEDFYAKHISNDSQLKAVNDLLFPCGYDNLIDWNDAYFELAGRLSVIILSSDSKACSEYMESIAGDCDDK